MQLERKTRCSGHHGSQISHGDQWVTLHPACAALPASPTSSHTVPFAHDPPATRRGSGFFKQAHPAPTSGPLSHCRLCPELSSRPAPMTLQTSSQRTPHLQRVVCPHPEKLSSVHDVASSLPSSLALSADGRHRVGSCAHPPPCC